MKKKLSRVVNFTQKLEREQNSETLVRLIAEMEGVRKEELGVKERNGILKSMKTRAAFLQDDSHKVVFYYTPKHASWMNQVEIFLSIKVAEITQKGELSFGPGFA